MITDSVRTKDDAKLFLGKLGRTRSRWGSGIGSGASMLFWALLASGQITMRKVDGWQTLATKPAAA